MHQIDGQLKANRQGVTLIGDKKGAGTTAQFAQHGVDYLRQFRAFLSVPIKMIHVIRNPFDITAAGVVRGRTALPELLPTVAALRATCRSDQWLDVYYEDLVEHPDTELARLLVFLGLEVLEAHRDACTRYLFRSPHRRRFEISWTRETRGTVEAIIDRYDFLRRYSWES
jgi:hypothetical protein